MRISSTVLGLAFVAGFAAPVLAADSPFVGKWTATAAAPTGPASETVTVIKTNEGYAITAKLIEPTPGQPEAGPGKDIVLEGDHFTYKRIVSVGGSELEITYSGVISGDKFTGSVALGQFGSYAYTGVRVRDGE